MLNAIPQYDGTSKNLFSLLYLFILFHSSFGIVDRCQFCIVNVRTQFSSL